MYAQPVATGVASRVRLGRGARRRHNRNEPLDIIATIEALSRLEGKLASVGRAADYCGRW